MITIGQDGRVRCTEEFAENVFSSIGMDSEKGLSHGASIASSTFGEGTSPDCE